MSGVSRASGHITYRKTSAYKRLVHIQVHAVHVMSRCNSYPDSLYSGKFNSLGTTNFFIDIYNIVEESMACVEAFRYFD